ncbi:MAG: nuclear transport factor 2 family protein [Proteobacteria bacterium]|nr:nuclear transport factor 2 family protein [Pseudomonadota bacterium]MBU1594027.1 nuclear transport factor 2 family protein [Pseudomonadota bacterium]
MSPAEAEVLDFIASLNACWTRGDAEDLGEYFHKDMVAVTPVDREPRVGREACVAGWAGFARSARIQSWAERGHRVKLFGDAAVVTYFYELRCRMGGAAMTLEGRDLFFLVREGGRWWAVADQFSSFPA